MTDATFSERYPFLFHGTRYMTAILRDGALRPAPVGDRHISLTTNMAEANHWAMVARDDDEGDGTIIVLSTPALLEAGYRPRRFWSKAASRDEHEWAVDTTIRLGRLVAGLIRPIAVTKHAAALAAATAAELNARPDRPSHD